MDNRGTHSSSHTGLGVCFCLLCWASLGFYLHCTEHLFEHTLTPSHSLQYQLNNAERHGVLLAHAHKRPPKATSHRGWCTQICTTRRWPRRVELRGLTAESTYSQGNSSVAILGVNIKYFSKSYNHTFRFPFRTLSSERTFLFFLFLKWMFRERDLPDSCSLFLCVKYKFPFCRTRPENTVFVNVRMHVEQNRPFRRSSFPN